MTKIQLNVQNEYDKLEHVIIGTAQGYHRNPELVEVLNETHRQTFEKAGHPTEASLTPEFEAFAQAMRANGVAVYQPELASESVQDQTCPRDIGFVIADTLVICTMRDWSRKEEFEGVRYLMDDWQGEIIQAPDDVFIEGGDVIIDNSYIFVGYGQRSNEASLDFMRQTFGDQYTIVPMPCQSLEEGENVLHLDCTFNPLGLVDASGKRHALIYPDGLKEIPNVVRENYTWLTVKRDEADVLATNVLSIAPDTIIAREGAACARVNTMLRGLGFTIVEVSFDGVPSTGGSFRCATMPLQRS